MTGYIGVLQAGVENITNLISNGSLASNTTSWTMASTYYTTTQYNGYIGSVVTTTSSTPRYHTQSFTSVSGSTAATKQVLYCQATVCGKPSNVSTPTVRVRQYKNGSSTATYTNLSSSTSSSINCNFSSINMSSLPSSGYAYAKINNGNTQYTNGTVTISKGDTITIYLNVGDNGNAGVYLYRDKLSSSDVPDYHEYSESLTYTWNSNNAPYDFMTVNITFEYEGNSTGYLNCFIKLVQAWNKNSAYLETYDGTDYYSYNRVEFGLSSTNTANATLFIKNIFIVNLTAKFGAGNEPTKAWCDKNLQLDISTNNVTYTSGEMVSIAHEIKNLYVGINDVARKVKKAYIGVNNVARLWYAIEYTIYYQGTATSLTNSANAVQGGSIGDYALFAGGKNGSTYYLTVDTYNSSLVHNTASSLYSAGTSVASANTSDYLLFAGGLNYTKSLPYVTIFDSSLIRQIRYNLSTPRYALAGASVGSYALFAGGYDNSSYFNVVDSFNNSLSSSTPSALTSSKANLAGASIGDYALFAGGWNGSSSYNEVDNYNSSLSKGTSTTLSQSRCYLSGVGLEKYVLFAGGSNNTSGSTVYNSIDAYNSSATRITSPTALTTARTYLAGGSIGDHAIFSGGAVSGGTVTTEVDIYNGNLVKLSPMTLSVARCAHRSASVGKYLLFAGGDDNGDTTTYYNIVDVFRADF